MTKMNYTRCDRNDSIAVITFDRDVKLNAFNTAMTAEVNDHIDAAVTGGADVLSAVFLRTMVRPMPSLPANATRDSIASAAMPTFVTRASSAVPALPGAT